MDKQQLKVGMADFQPGARCEIVRSFSYKLNVGDYESRDFFCSQKSECAIEDAADISERLYQFCKEQVRKSVLEYKRERESTIRARKAS